MAEIASKATPRRITIKKRDDFDGYGFNLHAEKGKPGQYVGKVDPNSPAELAGLREGDRIIEVNDNDIGSETHKQVVERIKAKFYETTLLVIAPHSFIPNKNGTSVAKKEESPVPSEKSMNNNNDVTKKDDLPSVPKPDNKHKTTENNSAVQQSTDNNNTKISTNETNSVVDAVKTQETTNHHVNNQQITKLTTTTTSTSDNNNHDKKMNENNSSAANGKSSSNTNGATTVLNLNMTATELRAKLLAKKKYDPKNDSIDLRKKYDIIEKM